MRKLALLLLVLSVFTLATLESLTAQTGYSIAGANPYVARKDWNGLLAYTQGWSRANPNEPMAWYYMGQTYGFGLNRPADAANAFQRAVSLKSQWPEAWWALAYTDVQLKRYPDALQAVSTAVQQAPDRLNYRNGLAAVYSELNRWDDVVRTLEDEQKMMESARTTEYDWYNLGNGFSNSKLFKEAEAAYSRALKMNPNLGIAWTNLGVVEQALGNSQGALADYQRGASLGDRFGSGNYSSLYQALTAPPAAPRRVAGARPLFHQSDPFVPGPPRDVSGVGYGGTTPSWAPRDQP